MKIKKTKNIPILLIIGFSFIILFVIVFMMLRNTNDLKNILEDSIKSQLISTSLAAREVIDVERFYSYNSMEDIENDKEAYMQTLAELRFIRDQFRVTYIYALKLIDGEYIFIFDTDEEDEEIFIEYFGDEDEHEVPDVFRDAFLGKESAGIMNVVDEYGSFNTGAVPIFKDGMVIGIVCTDIEDLYIQNSDRASMRNAIFMIITVFITMTAMIIIVSRLLRNVQTMQETLFRMANYDVLTGLPNRQYLMTYLAEIAENSLKNKTSFALFLIDLDNFKLVNDNAGHDAGDELLRHIAIYLDSIHENSTSFRPPAGVLNVSARIGGDEFIQVIPGIETEHDAIMAAEKVLMNFESQTLDRYIKKYHVGLSIGIALFPNHTDSYNVLIKYADIAMYHAKQTGKNKFCIYNEELNISTTPDSSDYDAKQTGERRQYRS